MSSNTTNITSIDIDHTKYSKENLFALRESFPTIPDEELARYLIARNNDLVKAREQLAIGRNWRASAFPIYKASCAKEFNSGKVYTAGVDKDGRPLLVWNARLNVQAQRDLNEATSNVLWWTEYTCRSQFPQEYSKFTVLMDRTQFKRENADLELAKHMSQFLQDGYPERVKTIIIYPADLLFYSIWNVAKWFMDPVTRTKVQPMLQLVGVEQFIDRKHIPRSMGGESDFVFNPENFQDYWTEEDVAANKKATAATSSEGTAAAGTSGAASEGGAASPT